MTTLLVNSVWDWRWWRDRNRKSGKEDIGGRQILQNSRISTKDALVMIVQTFFMQKIDTKNSTYSIPVLQKLIDIIETYYRIDKKNTNLSITYFFFPREVKISLIELYSYHDNLLKKRYSLKMWNVKKKKNSSRASPWEMPTTSNITIIGYDKK